MRSACARRQRTVLGVRVGVVRLASEVHVVTSSGRLLAKLDQARRLDGAERLAAILKAVAPVTDAELLEGSRRLWLDEERRVLATHVADTRHDAGRLAH